MVKVTGPLHSVEARGRLGTLEYNTWRGISFVKAHVDPAPPTSTLQLAQQARFKAICLQWATLTDAQRTLWNLYAVDHPRGDWTGKPVRMSGFNAYVKLNTYLTYMTRTNLTVPPGAIAFPVLKNITLNYFVPNYAITWSHITSPSDSLYDVRIRMTGPVSAGTQPDFKHAVLVGTVQMSYLGFDVPYAIASVPGKYGAWLQVLHRTTGVRSTWQLLICNIA